MLRFYCCTVFSWFLALGLGVVLLVCWCFKIGGLFSFGLMLWRPQAWVLGFVDLRWLVEAGGCSWVWLALLYGLSGFSLNSGFRVGWYNTDLLGLASFGYFLGCGFA